jgi:penicillin-binding protein 2
MYVGYAPYDNPEISISVVIENAGGGSSNAAPAARIVMDYYFSEIKPKGITLKTKKNDAAMTGPAQASLSTAETITMETSGG